MSTTEIVTYLSQILEKLDREGFSVKGTPQIITTNDYYLSTTPVHTETIDISTLKRKVIYFINNHDVQAHIQVESSYTPSGPFITIREDAAVPPNSTKLAVLNDYHPYIRITAWTDTNPTTGKFFIVVAGIT